ncbi:MAG: hypothetical protein QNJ41_28590 [Xenococcaceae cyanobacterium MO_188.B32]|nr:hypothetical protein [Xenococcaceae cyanobacterium MO_188.B32]
MTGKVLDNSATGILVLIIPIAFAIIVVYKLWPFLLLLAILIIAWRIWQNYQWQQWSMQVNPYFKDLIRENRGCLTPVDLSFKANLPARSARIFLERKAEEYGAQKKIVKDRGEVFYFLTAGALNTIFEDSEPPSTEEPISIQEEEAEYSPIKAPEFVDSLAAAKKQNKLSVKGIAQLAKQEQKSATVAKEVKADSSVPLDKTSETKVTTKTKTEMNPLSALIQADLAKRLDLNSSTVGRRKSKPDFPEWSQSKDPEGVAWKYLADKELFVPADTD